MQTFDFSDAPIHEIADIVTNEYNISTEHTGIRVFDAENEPRIGEKMDCSRVWIDNEVTEEYLDGTSAVQIDWRSKNLKAEVANAVRIAKDYCGDYIAIVGGEYAVYGVDNREIIIKHAVILNVWKVA